MLLQNEFIFLTLKILEILMFHSKDQIINRQINGLPHHIWCWQNEGWKGKHDDGRAKPISHIDKLFFLFWKLLFFHVFIIPIQPTFILHPQKMHKNKTSSKKRLFFCESIQKEFLKALYSRLFLPRIEQLFEETWNVYLVSGIFYNQMKKL